MDCYLLVTQNSVEGVLNIGAANSLCSLCQKVVELLDMVTSTDTEELKDWLVILQCQYGLVTYQSVSLRHHAASFKLDWATYCHET